MAERLQASPVRKTLVAALDDWAACADQKVRDWVLRVVRHMDPDPWRDRVRDPDRWERVEGFAELADTARVEEQPVTLMVAFAQRWSLLGGEPTAFMERVRRQHPDDFWVNFMLAHLLGESDPAASIGYCRAAEALRPDAAVLHTRLGYELCKIGRFDEATHYLNRAVQIDPKNPWDWILLGSASLSNGRTDEAADCFLKAMTLDPGNIQVRTFVPRILLRQGRGEEARQAWRQDLDRQPKTHDDWDGYAETFLAMMKSVRQAPSEGASSKNMYGELGGKPEGSGESFTVQHLREVAIDHQNGIFAGTNGLVEKLGGRPPMTLEAFIEKHRAAFE